jgi:hypothetical protein
VPIADVDGLKIHYLTAGHGPAAVRSASIDALLRFF